MDEASFKPVNEAYEMLEGTRAAGGKLEATDLAYICGLLKGALSPYRMTPQEAKAKSGGLIRRIVSNIFN